MDFEYLLIGIWVAAALIFLYYRYINIKPIPFVQRAPLEFLYLFILVPIAVFSIDVEKYIMQETKVLSMCLISLVAGSCILALSKRLYRLIPIGFCVGVSFLLLEKLKTNNLVGFLSHAHKEQHIPVILLTVFFFLLLLNGAVVVYESQFGEFKFFKAKEVKNSSDAS